MQAYVGIDVHRRRSQIAVMDEGGRTAVNRNVPNGREAVLGVIGDLPSGTPVAFEAAFGWGWLIEPHGRDRMGACESSPHDRSRGTTALGTPPNGANCPAHAHSTRWDGLPRP
ncbi:hypothetical protein AB0D34_13190 [Streptomyces sp. NPDC048420]|uniref:hypothetical protein n=1 Tax=Streptomyces sp. NPDC048420 TaxID=3155755 RepID=UPI003436D3C1